MQRRLMLAAAAGAGAGLILPGGGVLAQQSQPADGPAERERGLSLPLDEQNKLLNRSRKQVEGAFLTWPYMATDNLRKGNLLREGWLYTRQEWAIHGNPVHYALDLEAPYGTQVVAAHDGYAIRSYHFIALHDLRDPTGNALIGFGLGEFVQILHTNITTYSMYAHLAQASNTIAYVAPVQYNDLYWNPDGIYVPPAEYIQIGTKVERGQVIGYVGYSGLTPYEKFDPDTSHWVKPDTPSWDEIHLHFEAPYERVDDTPASSFAKANRRDSFAIYGQRHPDFNPYHKLRQESEGRFHGYWLVDHSGRPAYAA